MSSDNSNSTTTTAAGDKPKHQLSFKEQLDKAAFDAKNPDANKPQPSIVDKGNAFPSLYLSPSPLPPFLLPLQNKREQYQG